MNIRRVTLEISSWLELLLDVEGRTMKVQGNPSRLLNLIHVTPRSRITQTGTPPRHVKDVMDPWGQRQAMHTKYLRSMSLQCFEAIYSEHIIKNHHRRQRSNPLIFADQLPQ